MSALIITLFSAAGLLALAAMAFSAHHYGAAWSGIARELERCGEVPRKHLVYARRLKQPPARRARARARRAQGHEAHIAAKGAMASRKSGHNRYSGFGITPGPDRLMFE